MGGGSRGRGDGGLWKVEVGGGFGCGKAACPLTALSLVDSYRCQLQPEIQSCDQGWKVCARSEYELLAPACAFVIITNN